MSHIPLNLSQAVDLVDMSIQEIFNTPYLESNNSLPIKTEDTWIKDLTVRYAREDRITNTINYILGAAFLIFLILLLVNIIK